MKIFIALAVLASILTAHAGIIRQDVRSLSKSGSTKLIGDVTLSEGSNITLTQIGQNISITASGSSVTATANSVRFDLAGGIGYTTVPDPFDTQHRSVGTSTLAQVALGLRASGDSGYTGIEIYKNGVDMGGVTVTANGGMNSSVSTLSPPISLVDGDLIWPAITVNSTGAPEDLSVELIFQ